MEIDGEEFLFYRSFESLDVALLRGTTADPQGNVTPEREALTLESLEIAIAVHNRGGLVIVRVERLAESGALSPKDVKIPGILVDCVVVAARPEHHTQTRATTYDPGMSGELRVPTGALAPMPLDVRKVIARRAAMELRPNSVVNLGIGVPEGIAAVAAEEGVLKYVTLTTEPGVIGGLPLGGLDFGSALNAEAILAQPSQFDFYDGGGLDAAFLGMAQADRHGNVNVSRFGPRLAGAGGFVNISQNSKSVFFLGTFLAPARAEVRDGRIVHTDGMAAAKFIADVEQCTFAASNALITGQPVMYITERCVFQLTREGMALVEVAPGVDLERDVLAHLGFTPVIRRDPVTMDPRIFVDEPMGLRQDLLSIPVEARFAYDPERNTFFLNMEGMVLSAPAQVEEIGALVDARLAAIGHRVNMVVNYDNFVLARDLGDQYAATVRGLTEKYYESVRRYSTSAFMRLKLTDQLGGRGLAPHVYESRAEALARVDDRRPIAPPNPA
ncbi:CoA-transferase [Nocardioides sp. B-3]|uniref:CoA-transferase n=1 Tax=Nocardioides sp. B-3 TaxID=2895565 RepID=UPI002152BA4E|nr:CoA-transferase [Nocardioides sp. B-3]UUZ61131.1 hypothetical protein LP418_11185 [Nocardioides sp. B-3]